MIQGPLPLPERDAGAAGVPDAPAKVAAPTEQTDTVAWDAADEDKGRPCTRLGRVVDGWLSLLPDAARSWGRFEQFLEFMEGVSDMGDRERDLLLNRRMVCRLSSFFLQVTRLGVF